MRSWPQRYRVALSSIQGEWKEAEHLAKLDAQPCQAWTRVDYAEMLRHLGREPERSASLSQLASNDAARLGVDWLVDRCARLFRDLPGRSANGS